MLYDISQEVLSCRVYPGDPAPEARFISAIREGDAYNLTAFSMCAHNGTHVDAPYHFIENGRTLDQMGLAPFVGPCAVVRAAGDLTALDAEGILKKARELHAPERILMAGPVTVTPEAAGVFASARPLLLGVESQTFGPTDALMETHRILLGADIALLEGLVLARVPEGRCILCAAPLNLAGRDGAPCRAVLIGE